MYTVILPTRTTDPYLEEALDSVFSQSVAPAAVYVLASAGDGSFKDLSDRISAHFPGVWVAEVPDPGMIAALNFGISRVSTPFVAFLDSDDIWRPEKQQRQLALLACQSDLDAAFGLATNFTCENGDIRMIGQPQPSRMFTSTTFRTQAFSTFHSLDPTATHYTWLYRWWARAQGMGIRTAATDYLGQLRRIHSANSWRVGNSQAKRDLFEQLRRIQGGTAP